MENLTTKEIQDAIKVLDRMKEEIDGNYCGYVFGHGQGMSKALLNDCKALLSSRENYLENK